MIHPLKTAGVLVIVGLIIMLSALSRVIGDRKRGSLYLTLGGGALILLGTMLIPKIFNLETITLPINSYGFTIMVGFLLAIGIATRRAKPLGINTDIITNNLTIILGAFLASIALAFGLGSKDVIGDLMRSFYTRKNFEVGQKIHFGTITGTIQSG